MEEVKAYSEGLEREHARLARELRLATDEIRDSHSSVGEAIAIASKVESALQAALAHALVMKQDLKEGRKEMGGEDEDADEDDCVECASEEDEEIESSVMPAEVARTVTL